MQATLRHADCSFSCAKSFQCTKSIQIQSPATVAQFFVVRKAISLRTLVLCSSTDSTGGGSPGSPLPPPPNLRGKAPRKHWNAASLAFLGDSVWELYVRRRNFHPPTRVSDYYAIVVSQVRAEAQAEAYRTLESGTFLTLEERDVLRWGRNATGTSPKRLSQGGMTREIYRAATAIECLAGYLYLTDAARLHDLMIHLGVDEGSDQGGNAEG